MPAARVLSGEAASTSGATVSPWSGGRRAFLASVALRPSSATAAAAKASQAAATATATATTTALFSRPRLGRRQRLSVRVSASSSPSSAPSSSSSQQPPPPQLFSPPPFDPAKLTVTLLPGVARVGQEIIGVDESGGANAAPSPSSPPPPPYSFPLPRRYTLTHNDVTGALALSIGSSYNAAQLEGWYVRMIRDEVLAEWRREEEEDVDEGDGGDGGGERRRRFVRRRRKETKKTEPKSSHSLHVFCHVSGDARWLAPPRLRSRIFQREMALVLDTISHADADLLRAFPDLAASDVVVHLRSHVASLDARVVWGSLGDRSGWREPPRLLEGLLEGVVGDLWRGLGGGTELRADGAAGVGAGGDGSGFDDGGSFSSSAAASAAASTADFYYDGSSSLSSAAIDDEEMGALMSDDSFIAMAERDTVDDDDDDEEEEEEEDKEEERQAAAAAAASTSTSSPSLSSSSSSASSAPRQQKPSRSALRI